MEFVDGTLGLVDGGELDEPESLGAMGLAVTDDLDVLDGTNATEELEQVAFGRIEGEIAHIDAGRGHLNALRLPGLTRGRTFAALGTLAAGRALGRSRFRGLLATEADDGEELCQEALLLGRLLAAFGTFTAGSALGAAGGPGGATATAATAGTATTIGGIIGGHGMCCVKGSPRIAARDTGSGQKGIRTVFSLRCVFDARAPLLPPCPVPRRWGRGALVKLVRLSMPSGGCGKPHRLTTGADNRTTFSLAPNVS